MSIPLYSSSTLLLMNALSSESLWLTKCTPSCPWLGFHSVMNRTTLHPYTPFHNCPRIGCLLLCRISPPFSILTNTGIGVRPLLSFYILFFFRMPHSNRVIPCKSCLWKTGNFLMYSLSTHIGFWFFALTSGFYLACSPCTKQTPMGIAFTFTKCPRALTRGRDREERTEKMI